MAFYGYQDPTTEYQRPDIDPLTGQLRVPPRMPIPRPAPQQPVGMAGLPPAAQIAPQAPPPMPTPIDTMPPPPSLRDVDMPPPDLRPQNVRDVTAPSLATPSIPDVPQTSQPYRDALAYELSNPPKPKLWQRLAAGAVGGLAGAVNASGRTKIDPRVTEGATRGILMGGYDDRLARAGSLAQLERQREQDALKNADTQAGIDMNKSHMAYWDAMAKKALQSPASFKVMKVGNRVALIDADGKVTYPPPTLADEVQTKHDVAIQRGLKEGTPEYNQFVLGVTKTSTPSGADGKQSLQERLSALYAIPEASRTPQQQREMRSIERAMTLVANTYGAGYKMMSTAEGQPILFHPSQGAVAPPAGTRPPYAAQEREDVAYLSGMIEDLDTLRELGMQRKNKIGPVAGRIADVDRKLLGSDTETNNLFRIADSIADQVLRIRSGAQTSEPEAARLRKLTPDPRFAESKFFSDLDNLQHELKRLLAKKTGQASLLPKSAPKSDSVSQPSGANPLGSAIKPGDRTPDGGIIRSVKTVKVPKK